MARWRTTQTGPTRGLAARCVLAVLLASVLLGHARTASAVDGVDPVRQLVERHAPLLRMVEQPAACGRGEPYRPMRPDSVFGREGVELIGPSTRIDRPTQTDLPEGPAAAWYLDLPGDALRPGCRYEQLFDSWRTEPVVSGRVTGEPGRPDELVVQYWFFYLYNDWNDRHEGDWEMIQLVFDAGSPEEALEREPTLAMYAQHEGGEISEWRDDVLRTVEGTRPVVHVAAGSHASYFSSARWFGKSSQSGFGCDDTRSPLVDVDPKVEILDDAELPRWAAYTGHWGERRPSFNNGPTGPITKPQWSTPLTWMDEKGRRGAADLPDGGTVVTDAFCAATRVGSVVLFGLLDRPWAVLGAGVAVVVVGAAMLRRTRWRPTVVTPLLARRDVGQMATSALALVRRRVGLFAAIGLFLIVAGFIATGLQALLVSSTEVGDVADVAGRGGAWGALVALSIGAVTTVPGTAFVTVLSMLAARRLADGRAATLVDLVREVRPAWRAVVLAAVLPGLAAVLFVSIIGAPVAVFLLLRWSVAVPAALDDPAPLRRSGRLTRGHRGRAVAVAVTTVFWSNVVPVMAGIAALVVTDLSFTVVNLIASLVAAVTVPTAAVTHLMQWADLECRSSAPSPDRLVTGSRH